MTNIFRVVLKSLTAPQPSEPEMEVTPISGNKHLVYLYDTETSNVTAYDATFDIYEGSPNGTSVGYVTAFPTNVTFSILAGNTDNAFSINTSTGEIQVSNTLDHDVLDLYTLTVKAVSNTDQLNNDTATITINVLEVFSMCTVAVPHFDTYSNNLTGLLTVGDLIATTGTITDYAIEWRLNSTSGQTVLLSGYGSDPLLQITHPFTDEPVVSGDLYAVIRYVNIDGVFYSSYPYSAYGLYSPDLVACLGFLTVSQINCTSGNITGDYTHEVSYTNTIQLPEFATRTITFYLNTDGTTSQLAWYFNGYTIADRVTMTYVSGVSETPIIDWVIGYDSVEDDFVSTPKVRNNRDVSSVIDISNITYTSGDYIKIHITPSYNDPLNTDTNWLLRMACFTFADPYTIGGFDNATNTIDTGSFNLVWNAAECRYDLTFDTGSSMDVTVTDLYKYNDEIFTGLYAIATADWGVAQGLYLEHGTETGLSYGNGYFGTDYLLDGIMTLSKLGSVFTYSFDTESDYLIAKGSYDAAILTSEWLSYSADPTSLDHYKLFRPQVKISMTEGDTFIDKLIPLSYDTVIVFDGVAKTITCTMSTQVNGIIPEDCNDAYSYINAWAIGAANQFINEADFTYQTIWGLPNLFAFIGFNSTVSEPSERYSNKYFMVNANTLGENLDNLTSDWFLQNGYWYFYKFYIKLVITNMSDPVNHYKVYNKLLADGSVDTVWTEIFSLG